MSSFEKLIKAKTLLGLGEKASLAEIKNRYKTLIKKWHPDKHKNDAKTATKMSAQINEAYEILLAYCNNYDYPFDEESLKKTSMSPQEWWEEKFGTKKNSI
ncbi:J domain-containing protein [Sulfurimonas sp. HSL-1716]|uniref:J domain-containing protein n=1 Tax=Hydrocurvibacter sulfurireducens TaxID=3131937 RepID=UPI0031F88116